MMSWKNCGLPVPWFLKFLFQHLVFLDELANHVLEKTEVFLKLLAVWTGLLFLLHSTE